jgi:hypothetical protein
MGTSGPELVAGVLRAVPSLTRIKPALASPLTCPHVPGSGEDQVRDCTPLSELAMHERAIRHIPKPLLASLLLHSGFRRKCPRLLSTQQLCSRTRTAKASTCTSQSEQGMVFNSL